MEILILLIEDNTMFSENVEEILTLEGYQVVTANCGLTGVSMARTLLPDLIICDIIMDKLDGYGVLAELKNSPQTCDIPFIFSTSKSENCDKEKARALGVKNYLVKPFDILELTECIEDCIR